MQSRQSRILLRDSTQQNEGNASRTRSPGGRSPSGKMARLRARITSKDFAPLHSVKNCILQNACSTRPKMDADLGKSALMCTTRLMNSLAKRSKKYGDKSAVVMLKVTRQFGCVFQDMEPPKSSSILQKSSNTLKLTRCVRFTKPCYVMLTFDQNPSLGMICPGDLHQRNPKCSKI